MMKKITLLAMLCLASLHLTQAQTYFSDDFSDLDLTDWTLYDADGDGNNWAITDWSTQGPEIAEFDNVLNSRSWTGATGGLNPDNYVVSSAIDLTGAPSTGLQLAYAYGTIEGAPYHQETYDVYVTTSNTLSALQAATPIHTETLANPGTRETNTIDMSAYAGQTVYLSFRHYNTFDMNVMIVDDIVIRVPVDSDAIVNDMSLSRYSLTSEDNELTINITNNGGLTINSLDINWSDGTSDNTATIATSIAPGATVNVAHPMMVNYGAVVEKDITATVTLINGSADADMTNNSSNALFNTLSQSGTKAILIEEATGTWCGYCPRGAIGLEYITSAYPETVVGVAVHNSDPMAVTAYDNGIGTFISGYPSGVIDRSFTSDPSSTALQTAYNQLNDNLIAPVGLSSSADLTGAVLTIEANANFYTTFSAADFRLGVIITENNVTGTSTGYNQVNYYSNNALGPMGGYENLPDPVPAAQMVYDHVGRALLGGFNGETGSVPTVINDGDIASHTFTYTIPTSSAQENLKIVVVLIDNADGTVVSAQETSVDEALSVIEISAADGIKLFPNPAKDILNISFNSGTGHYKINVTDMLGRTVISNTFNDVFNASKIALPVSQLSAGHYIINIASDKGSYSTKFIINK